MSTKQFRIGKRAVGGIIKVGITGRAENLIQIHCIDSNSKRDILSAEFSIEYRNAYRNVDEFLNHVTSSYHADKIMTWLKPKVKFKKENWFCRIMTQLKSRIEKESCF
jgi:hypothetical protein